MPSGNMYLMSASLKNVIILLYGKFSKNAIAKSILHRNFFAAVLSSSGYC